MITTVLFDMDGTLLPVDYDEFVRAYFGLLCKKAAPHGYDPKTLADAVWKGTAAMVANNGMRSNETVFWETFAQIFGPESLGDKAMFDDFYKNEYQGARAVCGCEPAAARLVHDLKAAGIRTVLATNPIFPAEGINSRIRWAGIEPEEFALVTTYENSRHCKPNPAYYRDILDDLGLAPQECVMVGNDAQEDMAAAELGIPVFLLTEYLLHGECVDLDTVPHGGWDDLRRWLSGLGIGI